MSVNCRFLVRGFHCPGLTRGSFAASGGLHRAPLLAGPLGARYTGTLSAWPTGLSVTRFDEWVAPAYWTRLLVCGDGGSWRRWGCAIRA